MKGFLIITSLLCLVMTSAYAQRQCGSMDYLEQQIKDYPERLKDLNKIENHIRNFDDQASLRDLVTIPVVVHVVYRNQEENISDAQIQSQLDVLNEDFRRLNSDANSTWSQAADSEIEFCLASVDPNGNTTSGITRTATTVNGFGTNDAVKFTSQGGKDAWPSGDYLNFWVCNIGGGILGYAQFPGGSVITDGVVNGYQYTGTIGTATAPFNLGRTATHEVGHWLNLRHIWGDGGCGVDDFVSDTPTSDAPNYGCASGHTSCGSTDMVENYMDYSDDGCMNLFTAGQKTRMQSLFGPQGARASLLYSNGCGAGSPPTCDDGIQNGNETAIDCGGPDCLDCPTCQDGIQNGDEIGVDCGGSCEVCPIDCNDNIVMVSITFDNYPEETSWSIIGESGEAIAAGGTYGSEADGSTLEVQLCLADGCYDFMINDTYGDGICCAYGNGSYSVFNGNTSLVNGSSFSNTDITNFCINGSNEVTCSDGLQNGDETGVDCGGTSCDTCVLCDDGVQNGDEEGIDCGGSNCIACPTCNDGIQNGGETGVDCGGECMECPIGCVTNELTISITLDNYPGETSWTLVDANGNQVAAGGTYANEQDGSTITIEECLADGCYDFTIFDSYGDGICCTYGNGSYSVLYDGIELAEGGSFTTSEVTNICLSNDTTSECDDGTQNGDETGIDCGGSCDPCDINGGLEIVGAHYFETGWEGWLDGGSDCYRYNGVYSWEGNYSIRIRDNSGSVSSMSSSAYDLSSYGSVEVEFYFYPNSMETGEDFWLRYNDGSGWQTIATYTSGIDFNNDIYYAATVTLDGANYNLVDGGQFRFQCDASGNADRVYLDQVIITGSIDGSKEANRIAQVGSRVGSKSFDKDSDISIYPNPASDRLVVSVEENITKITIFSITGQMVYQSKTLKGLENNIDISNLLSGIYMISVDTEEEVITEKFIKE